MINGEDDKIGTLRGERRARNMKSIDALEKIVIPQGKDFFSKYFGEGAEFYVEKKNKTQDRLQVVNGIAGYFKTIDGFMHPVKMKVDLRAEDNSDIALRLLNCNKNGNEKAEISIWMDMYKKWLGMPKETRSTLPDFDVCQSFVDPASNELLNVVIAKWSDLTRLCYQLKRKYRGGLEEAARKSKGMLVVITPRRKSDGSIINVSIGVTADYLRSRGCEVKELKRRKKKGGKKEARVERLSVKRSNPS